MLLSHNAPRYSERATPSESVLAAGSARPGRDGADHAGALPVSIGHKMKTLRVLLVEDDPGDARLLRKYLAESTFALFDVEAVACLSEATSALGVREFDVCLLDLSLPDGSGLDAFLMLAREAPELPFVLLSESEDDAMALHAVQYGAQDHLVKAEISGATLPRTLLYAVERQRIRTQMRALSMQDALTGLYNRRGFFSMAEQNLKAAHRERRAMALFYADLDGLKEINDNFGHQEGDWALIKAADILRATFRDSDIAARLSGDEFTVLSWVQSPQDIERVKVRLSQHIADVNRLAHRRFLLLISVGAAFVPPGEAVAVDDLLARADALLYEAKKDKPASVLRPPINTA